MRTSARFLFCIGLGLLLSVHAAECETIGLFFDQGCASCSATASVGETITMYVSAARGGANAVYPITVVDFRIVGLPSGWLVQSTPHPAANAVVGDPFLEGIVMAFSPPLGGACVSLLTCTITATTSVDNVVLTVASHSDPLRSCFGEICPCLRCEGPPECISCTQVSPAVINGNGCVVGIQQLKWATIKHLYQ